MGTWGRGYVVTRGRMHFREVGAWALTIQMLLLMLMLVLLRKVMMERLKSVGLLGRQVDSPDFEEVGGRLGPLQREHRFAVAQEVAHSEKSK